MRRASYYKLCGENKDNYEHGDDLCCPGLPSTHSTTLYDTPNMYEKVFVDEDLEGQVSKLSIL